MGGVGEASVLCSSPSRSGWVKKWKKQSSSLFWFLPSYLPFASNHAVACEASGVRLWPFYPLHVPFWGSCRDLCCPPAPLHVAMNLLSCLPASTLKWKKPVKMNIWQRNCPDLRRKFAGFYSLPVLLQCKLETSWRERGFAASHSGSGCQGGWLGALGLWPGLEEHFAPAQQTLASQGAIVLPCDSVPWQDSGCELLAESSCPFGHWPELS